MVCTLPKLVWFYDWFEKKFSDLCKEHDAIYIGRSGSKFKADIAFAKGMWKRGHPVLAVGSLFFCSTVGWWYWFKD